MPRPTPAVPILSTKQERALCALLVGASLVEAAAAADTRRETLSRWLHQDASFVAELARRRHELWAGTRDALRALLPKAVDVVADALASQDPRVRLKAALALIQVAGVDQESLEPPGAHLQPHDPDVLLAQWVQEERGWSWDRLREEQRRRSPELLAHMERLRLSAPAEPMNGTALPAKTNGVSLLAELPL
jgi:hypothetical protein